MVDLCRDSTMPEQAPLVLAAQSVPYMEGMQPESRRNRRLSVGFGIAGHAMSFLSAAQRKEGEEDEERRKRRKKLVLSIFVTTQQKQSELFLYLLLQNLQV